MTKLLEKAIKEVSKLPEEDQDVCTAILLEEPASENRWVGAFTGSQDELARLANEAIAEYRNTK